MEKHSAEVTELLNEIYLAYWRDGLTIGQIAKDRGKTPKTIEKSISRLRKRAKSP